MNRSILFLLLSGVLITGTPLRAENWMARLPDKTFASYVTIPGSHDAATGSGWAAGYPALGDRYARTQDLTIGEQWTLGIRAFDANTRREVYERQLGVCPICGQHFELEQMEADHITPWCKGGRTIADNCQMLCRECNRRKSGK